MRLIACSVLASSTFLSACGGDHPPTPAAAPAQASPIPAAPPAQSAKVPAETPKPPAGTDVDEAFKALMAKPEQPDPAIEVQHILIAFQGAPRMTKVTRSFDEAKALAQKVYAEAIGGGDFDALVRKYTDDSAPGIYPMTQASRRSMVKGFQDVGFHLKVGEIGVSPWDKAASPFGWHIIKRLK